MQSNDTISVVVMSPQAVVWEGAVVSLTSANSEGVFDLLPDHARFMTLLEKTPVTLVLGDGTEKVIAIEKAVLFFQDNTAKIYIHETMAL